MPAVSLRAIFRRPIAFNAQMRALARDQQGATAIEFALVAFPFFAILFAIIEVCLVFFAGQLLEKATQDTTRLILTGQAQQGGMTEAQFKQRVCNEVSMMLDCSKLYVDVKNYPTFAAVPPLNPINNGNLVNSFGFQPGGPGDVVIARVLYPWQLFVPTMGLNLSNMNNNVRLLTATTVFRTEPYRVAAAPTP
jgi:Flp pilus assembly protein TadG